MVLWLCAHESVSMVPFRLKSTTYRVLRGPKEANVWDPCLGCGSGVTREHGALINPPTGCPVRKERQKALLYEKHDSKEKKKRQWSLAFSLFLLNTCSPVYFKSTLKFFFFIVQTSTLLVITIFLSSLFSWHDEFPLSAFYPIFLLATFKPLVA